MLRIRFNKKQTESSKTKKSFFPVTLKALFLTQTQILQMLQERLKCKQLEEKIQS